MHHKSLMKSIVDSGVETRYTSRHRRGCCCIGRRLLPRARVASRKSRDDNGTVQGCDKLRGILISFPGAPARAFTVQIRGAAQKFGPSSFVLIGAPIRYGALGAFSILWYPGYLS